ncbi:hypothetical protein CEXT_769721, partial [Caerostris extrusa]
NRSTYFTESQTSDLFTPILSPENSRSSTPLRFHHCPDRPLSNYVLSMGAVKLTIGYPFSPSNRTYQKSPPKSHYT